MNQIEKDIRDLIRVIESMDDNEKIKDLRSKTAYIYLRNKIKYLNRW